MAGSSARYQGELKLTNTGCMGGEAEADKLAGESTVPLTRILDIATVRPGIGGKSEVDVGSFGEEETDLGALSLLKKQRVSSPLPVKGGKVDPMSGERSGKEDDIAAEIQQYKTHIKKLEGELQHYQLRVAGVAALVNMLNEKKEEASQWKEKSQRLETALSRMEHKAGKLEKELRDRSAGSEESGRRMAPVLPPNKQLLNKMARDKAQLQMALNRLMGKGIYSYQEGLVSSALMLVVCVCVCVCVCVHARACMCVHNVCASTNLHAHPLTCVDYGRSGKSDRRTGSDYQGLAVSATETA